MYKVVSDYKACKSLQFLLLVTVLVLSLLLVNNAYAQYGGAYGGVSSTGNGVKVVSDTTLVDRAFGKMYLYTADSMYYMGYGTHLQKIISLKPGVPGQLITTDGVYESWTSVGIDTGAYWNRNTGSGLMYLTSGTDKVGIGTNTPAEKLHVDGNVQLTDNDKIGLNVATTGAYLEFDDQTQDEILFRNAYLGIGSMSTPLCALDVFGTGLFRTATTGNLYILHGASYTNTSSLWFSYNTLTNTDSRFRFYNSGRYGFNLAWEPGTSARRKLIHLNTLSTQPDTLLIIGQDLNATQDSSVIFSKLGEMKVGRKAVINDSLRVGKLTKLQDSVYVAGSMRVIGTIYNGSGTIKLDGTNIYTGTDTLATKAYARTQSGTSSYVVNIMEFGASVADSFDNSAAINSAIAYAKTNKVGVVYFPSGTYWMDSVVVNGKDSLTFLGQERTIIKSLKTFPADYATTAYGYGLFYFTGGCEHITFDNITFDLTASQWYPLSHIYPIYFYSAAGNNVHHKYITIKNCTFTDCGAIKFNAASSDTSAWSVLIERNNFFPADTLAGIDFDTDGFLVTIAANHYHGNGLGRQFVVGQIEKSSVTNNKIHKPADSGIYLGSSEVAITHNYLDKCGKDGIKVIHSTGRNINVSNNIVNGVGYYDRGSNVGYNFEASNVILNANMFVPDTAGYYWKVQHACKFGANADSSTISNNRFYGIGYLGGQSDGSGIRLSAGASDLQIQGNAFGCFEYGVVSLGDSTRRIYINGNNYFFDNRSNDIRFADSYSSRNNLVIENNIFRDSSYPVVLGNIDTVIVQGNFSNGSLGHNFITNLGSVTSLVNHNNLRIGILSTFTNFQNDSIYSEKLVIDDSLILQGAGITIGTDTMATRSWVNDQGFGLAGGSGYTDSLRLGTTKYDVDRWFTDIGKLDTTNIDTTQFGKFVRDHQSSGGGGGTGDFLASDFNDSLAAQGFNKSDTTAKLATKTNLTLKQNADADLTDLADGTLSKSKVQDSGNWDSAYSWGNHASAGYLTSQTSHADVVVDGDFTSQGILLRGASSGVYSILVNNSTNWNTAYGWGNHASAGYLTAETGDISAVTAGNGLTGGGSSGAVTLTVDSSKFVTTYDNTLKQNADADLTDLADGTLTKSKVQDSGNWDSAYGWGNHASAGYLTSQTSHADVVVDGDFTSQGIMLRGASGGVYSILTNNSTNWNTAYGWGNHASASYLTGNQTITLSGDVTGSGTTSITAALANNTVNSVEITNGSIQSKDVDSTGVNGIVTNKSIDTTWFSFDMNFDNPLGITQDTLFAFKNMTHDDIVITEIEIVSDFNHARLIVNEVNEHGGGYSRIDSLYAATVSAGKYYDNNSGLTHTVEPEHRIIIPRPVDDCDMLAVTISGYSRRLD